MLDINIYPFPPIHSAPENTPGLLVIPATRKAARGRENDVLVLFFTLSGSTAITAEGLRTWLEKKAEVYHRAPGTVTTAMRAVIDGINADLLERNSRHTKEGGQVSGHLQLAVVKREMLYLANLGSGKTLVTANNENLEIVDGENNARGLGVNQTVTPRFIQTPLAANDAVVLSFNAPEAWTGETLNGSQTLSLEAILRRLYSQPAGSARGILLRFKEGTGKFNLLSLRPANAAPEQKEPVAVQAKPDVLPQAIPQPIILGSSEPQTTAEPQDSQPPESSAAAGGVNEEEQTPVPVVVPSEAQPLILKPIKRGQGVAQSNSERQTSQVAAASAQNEPGSPQPEQESQTDAIKSAVGSTLRKGAQVKGKVDGFMKDAVQKVMPGEADQPARFPRSLLIIIAVVVPLLIVAGALSLYNRNGRVGLFDAYLSQAQQISVRADSQTADVPARLKSLQESLYWLNKASEYGQSDQSDALRLNLQSSIDSLQGIIRINMVAALSDGLPSTTSISQIVATNTDFYALDANSGKVLRFFVSGSAYEQDKNFNCGPSDQNLGNNIGKIVDMVSIPADNSYKATLLTIDSKGVLDYCVPGDAGYIVALEAPDMGWGAVKSISMYQNFLYVLDITGNAVYRFKADGVTFAEKPTLFFDEIIPTLTQAIDIEVVGYELYILRSNGQMVECTYSPIKDMKSTECQDPANYTDTRNGTVTQALTFPEAQFIQMHLTQAPDSSLYFLDAKGDTVYHFSYARSLQRVLHPRIEDGINSTKLTPTAFAISSGRMVFMAYGSELFFGQMP